MYFCSFIQGKDRLVLLLNSYDLLSLDPMDGPLYRGRCLPDFIDLRGTIPQEGEGAAFQKYLTNRAF